MSRLKADLAWGLRRGVLLALACIGFAMAASFLAGRPALDGWSNLSLVALYLVSGCCAGLVIGLMRPIANSAIGFMVIGFVVMLPVGGLFLWLDQPEGFQPWRDIPLVALIGGPACGLGLWIGVRPSGRRSRGQQDGSGA